MLHSISNLCAKQRVHGCVAQRMDRRGLGSVTDIGRCYRQRDRRREDGEADKEGEDVEGVKEFERVGIQRWQRCRRCRNSKVAKMPKMAKVSRDDVGYSVDGAPLDGTSAS